MWNKRPSYFLVIKFRRRGRRLVWPLPLYVFADALAAVADLIALLTWLCPPLRPAHAVLAEGRRLLAELRRPGCRPLAEIAVGGVEIGISFY